MCIRDSLITYSHEGGAVVAVGGQEAAVVDDDRMRPAALAGPVQPQGAHVDDGAVGDGEDARAGRREPVLTGVEAAGLVVHRLSEGEAHDAVDGDMRPVARQVQLLQQDEELSLIHI